MGLINKYRCQICEKETAGAYTLALPDGGLCIACADCYSLYLMTKEPRQHGLLTRDMMDNGTDTSIMDTKSGEDAAMEEMREETFTSLTGKHVTFLSTLHKLGKLEDLEKALDICLAHAEAERQVNEWLDVLSHPKTSKTKRARITRLLKQHAAEYQWLTEERQKLDHQLKKSGRVKTHS